MCGLTQLPTLLLTERWGIQGGKEKFRQEAFAQVRAPLFVSEIKVFDKQGDQVQRLSEHLIASLDGVPIDGKPGKLTACQPLLIRKTTVGTLTLANVLIIHS